MEDEEPRFRKVEANLDEIRKLKMSAKRDIQQVKKAKFQAKQ